MLLYSIYINNIKLFTPFLDFSHLEEATANNASFMNKTLSKEIMKRSNLRNK